MKSPVISILLLPLLINTVAQASPNACESLFHNSGRLTALSGQERDLNHLMSLAAQPGSSETLKARQAAAQHALQLDDVNFAYYMSLYQKYSAGGTQTDMVKLYPAHDANLIAYPLGSKGLPDAINANRPTVEYNEIAKDFDGTESRNAVLLVKKMQAGTGSSLTRTSYLARNSDALGLGSDLTLGAKGTDLMAHIPDPRNPKQMVSIPLVEIQLLQAYAAARAGDFSKLILQDIVGPETQKRLAAIWLKPSLIDPSLTYEQLFAKTAGLDHFKSVFQAHVPALDEHGQVSLQRKAPAGHGLFAVDALREAIHPSSLPAVGDRALIGVISNGEDLSSQPDPVMIDWMIKTKKPIVLVTTSKTPVDKKGGILCLVKDQKTGETFLKVVETAQAKAAGQLAEFEKTDGYASTNLTLFNYKVLAKKLAGISEADLLKVMAPDLVPNWKEQKDKDGVVRKYMQLEGTVGSAIMNLDRYFRAQHGEALVSVINVSPERRTDFFAPVKSAFDYFLQFNSDRFSIDSITYRLKNLGTTDLLKFSLSDPSTQDKYYQDVDGVLKSFGRTSVRDLARLDVSGQVLLNDSILKGNVTLKNETSRAVDLKSVEGQLPRSADHRVILDNIEIVWTSEGAHVTSLQAPAAKESIGIAHARVGTSGSHTDYNGGLTLAALLPVKTTTTLKRRDDKQVNILSDGMSFSYELGHEKRIDDWGDYIQGITAVLREDGYAISGFDAKIRSDIPRGAGISSSAALTVSVLKALRTANALPIDDLQIAKMGQRVERFVGANTGLLDQMTISILGDDVKSALAINFTDMSYKKVTVPDNAEFVIVHSGLTHSLKDVHGDRNYATRRAQTEAVAKQFGLTNLSALSMRELLRRKDELTPVLYSRALHIVSENERVKSFSDASAKGDLKGMGQAMSESHVSQRDNYDISEGPINLLVSILEKTPGVYGAQLTGGGFGGAVVFLAKTGDGVAIAQKAMDAYLKDPSNAGQFKPSLIAPVVAGAHQ